MRLSRISTFPGAAISPYSPPAHTAIPANCGFPRWTEKWRSLFWIAIADSCSDPVLSPDGSLAAYVHRGLGSDAAASQPFIELLTISSGQTRRISPAGNTAGSPGWAAQGWLSYYDGTRQVIVIDDLAGGQTVIPNATGAAWSWLPDGSGLIFPEILVEEQVTDRETAARIYSRLYRVNVKTNERTNLSGTELLEDASPAVSPGRTAAGVFAEFFRRPLDPGQPALDYGSFGRLGPAGEPGAGLQPFIDPLEPGRHPACLYAFPRDSSRRSAGDLVLERGRIRSAAPDRRRLSAAMASLKAFPVGLR